MKRFRMLSLFIVFIFSFFAFLGHTTEAHATSYALDEGNNKAKAFDAAAMGNMNKTGYNAGVVEDVMVVFTCHAIGKWCSDIPAKQLPYLHSSALGYISDTIGSMYQTPPASMAFWIQDTARTLGFLHKPAYAQGATATQGVGFTGLAPLLPIWRVFRNFAYALLSIVLIVVGLMVMFRRKIDPKTVVSVQNALPRIVLTLILITFSYAIVGLMIDLMYVLIFFLTALFQSADKALTITGSQMATADLHSVFYVAFPNGIWSMLQKGQMINPFDSGATGGVQYLFELLGKLGTLDQALPILIGLLIALLMLFLFIRLFFLFLNAYVQIIISLVIAPIQLLLDAVPGGNGFSNWFKNLLVNLSVFPIAAFMILLSRLFSDMATQTAATGGGGKMWYPPYLLLIEGSGIGRIEVLFSIGVLLLIPQVINSIKQGLKTSSLGGIGMFVSPLTSTATTGLTLAQQSFYAKSLFGSVLSGLLGKSGGKPDHH